MSLRAEGQDARRHGGSASPKGRRPGGPSGVPAATERRAMDGSERANGTTPMSEVEWRTHVKVGGRVRSMRIQPWAGVATLECTIMDETGGVVVVFLGRREVAGIHCGSHLVVEGTVGVHGGRLAILNPDYEIVPA